MCIRDRISITQAELNFILQDGPDFDSWTLSYAAEGAEAKTVTFSGHSVEIGMDGKKTVSALSDSALELSAAAARILNIFYACLLYTSRCV